MCKRPGVGDMFDSVNHQPTKDKQVSNLEVYEQFKKDLSNYVFKVVIIAVIIMIGYTLLPNTYDSTDGGMFDRSGVSLRIDHQSGCHYLEGASGGITPRVDAEGNHICTGEE